MKESSLQIALYELLEENAAGNPHVTPELLVAYHHDRLLPEEAEAVQEHLANCRLCADQLLELIHFEDGGTENPDRDETPGVEDLETAADWKALRSRIVREYPQPPLKTRPYVLYGLLAATLLLSVGLSAFVLVLRGELEALKEPQVNLAIVNLYADGFSRGDADEATVDKDGDRFVVILNPPSFPSNLEHRVEILDPDGRRLWSGDGLRRTEAGNFHVELSHQLLKPGPYRIHLFEGSMPIAEFDLQLIP